MRVSAHVSSAKVLVDAEGALKELAPLGRWVSPKVNFSPAKKGTFPADPFFLEREVTS